MQIFADGQETYCPGCAFSFTCCYSSNLLPLEQNTILIFNRPSIKATQLAEFPHFSAVLVTLVCLSPSSFGRNYVWLWKIEIFRNTSSFFRVRWARE